MQRHRRAERTESMSDEGRVHPDCRNASNPYHECSEFCFKVIAETKARMDQNQSGYSFNFLLSSSVSLSIEKTLIILV